MYFLKQAGRWLSSQGFQGPKQENDDKLGLYSCTVDGELDWKKLPLNFSEVKVWVGRKLRSQIRQMMGDLDKLPEFGFRDHRGMIAIGCEHSLLLELSDEWLNNYLRYFMNYSGIHSNDVYAVASGHFGLVEINNWKNAVPDRLDLSIIDLLQCDMNFSKIYITLIE